MLGLERSLKRVARRSPALRKAYYRLVSLRHGVRLKSAGARGGTIGEPRTQTVNPANMIWIFCTSRSGSTWLRSMLEDLIGGETWEEPKVGQLFGEFYNKAQEGQLGSANFILGDPTRKGWTGSIRNFVLDGARYAHPSLDAESYLVIKEPDGAAGAPLLMEALPESRMILLIRDPRDVAASALDAARRGSWMYEGMDESGWKKRDLADRRPDRFVRGRATAYVRQMSNARCAYDSHSGPKALIRYEDLKTETLDSMRTLCSSLRLSVRENDLAQAVEKHSWERVPENEKGEGRFYRKATPGGWREDLTPHQVEIVEEITAPILREFYP